MFDERVTESDSAVAPGKQAVLVVVLLQGSRCLASLLTGACAFSRVKEVWGSSSPITAPRFRGPGQLWEIPATLGASASVSLDCCPNHWGNR